MSALSSQRLALLALAVGFACSPAPEKEPPVVDTFTAAEAALIVDTEIRAHVGELAEALKAFEASEWIGDLVGRNECPPVEPGMPNDCRGPLDVTAQTDALANFLRDHVFNAASVETQTDTSVTYRLRAADVCPQVMDTNEMMVPDADCAQFLADVPVRLVVTNPAENSLNIAISVGTSAPATFTLDPSKVSVAINLAQAKLAVEQATAAIGESAILPSTLEGTVDLALVKQASLTYELVLGVTATVRVGANPVESPDHYLVTVAPAARALAFTLDGAGTKVLAGLGFGSIDAALALDLIMGEPGITTCLEVEPYTCTTTEPTPKTGVVAIHVPGVSGSGDFNGTANTLNLTNLGLGDATATVKYGGLPVLSFDLNELAGRRVNVLATHGEGSTSVQVTPSLSAKLVHDLTPLLSQLGEDVPEWAKNGWVSVAFNGATTPTIVFADGASSTPEEPPCRPGEEGCVEEPPMPVECGGEGQPACEEPTPVECGNEGQPACEEPAPALPAKLATITAGTLTFAANDVTPVSISAPMCVFDGGEGDHPIQLLQSMACE